jgi:hypothetical protein
VKTFKVIAVGALAFCGFTATTVAAHVRTTPRAADCGGNLWRLKTLSDPGRNAVNLAGRSTTIAAIAARHAPSRVPTRRTTPFQKQTWDVVAQITEYRAEEGELRLVLFDHDQYMNVVVPTPGCLSSASRARTDIASTYRDFVTSCGKPNDSWQPLGAVAYVRGVGYWSQRRTAHGTAANGAELHPVTGLRIVAGCG